MDENEHVTCLLLKIQAPCTVLLFWRRFRGSNWGGGGGAVDGPGKRDIVIFEAAPRRVSSYVLTGWEDNESRIFPRPELRQAQLCRQHRQGPRRA